MVGKAELAICLACGAKNSIPQEEAGSLPGSGIMLRLRTDTCCVSCGKIVTVPLQQMDSQQTRRAGDTLRIAGHRWMPLSYVRRKVESGHQPWYERLIIFPVDTVLLTPEIIWLLVSFVRKHAWLAIRFVGKHVWLVVRTVIPRKSVRVLYEKVSILSQDKEMRKKQGETKVEPTRGKYEKRGQAKHLYWGKAKLDPLCIAIHLLGDVGQSVRSFDDEGRDKVVRAIVGLIPGLKECAPNDIRLRYAKDSEQASKEDMQILAEYEPQNHLMFGVARIVFGQYELPFNLALIYRSERKVTLITIVKSTAQWSKYLTVK